MATCYFAAQGPAEIGLLSRHVVMALVFDVTGTAAPHRLRFGD